MELESDANMTFNSEFGYSSEYQGQYGWYYEYEQNGVYTEMGKSGTEWTGGEAFAINYSGAVHLGASVGVVKTFVAPYSGIIDISGYAYKYDADGCQAKIIVSQNGVDLFADNPIATITPAIHTLANSVRVTKEGIEVEKGDRITIGYYSADGTNSFGRIESAFNITYTKVLDDSFSTPHLFTVEDEIPAVVVIGNPVKFSGYVSPSGTDSNIECAILSSTYSKAVDAFVDGNGMVHVFVPGNYILCVYDTETKMIVYKHEFTAIADASGKTNNSYLEYDGSFTAPQQGIGNWYYMYQDGENFVEMSRNFGGTWWQGVYTYSLIAQQATVLDIGPDNPTRAWKAPANGTINFAVVGRVPVGVPLAYEVYVNNELKGSVVVNGNVPVGLSYFDVEVQAGDYIYVVAKNAGYGTAGAELWITANISYSSIYSQAPVEFTDLVTSLPSESEFAKEDITSLEAAKEAYANLTTLEKAFVDAEVLAKVASLDELLVSFDVIDAINALPSIEAITSEDKDAISNIYVMYSNLNEKQQAKVTNYEMLVAADNKIAGLGVVSVIASLPTEITLENEEQVQSARNAYEALNAAQKEYVTNLATLEAAEATIAKLTADLEAVSAVEEKIDDLPETITLVDRVAVNLAKDAYDSLTDERKALVDSEKVSTLNAAIATIELLTQEKNEVEAVEQLVEALPTIENITIANKEAVDNANNAYAALKDHQKSAVSNADKLTAAVEKINSIITAQNAAVAVVEQISALPTELKLTDKAAVEAARSAYDTLSDLAKTYVENLDNLELAEATIASLEATKAAIDNVIAKISALPTELKLTDKATVEAARSAYNALSEESKALVTNLATLEEAEATIASLEATKAAADSVIATIAALPTEVQLTDKAAVEAARSAYDALSEESKALVTNLAKLEAAEATIASLEATPEPTEEPSKGNAGIIIAISLGAVVLVAGAVLLVIKKRK